MESMEMPNLAPLPDGEPPALDGDAHHGDPSASRRGSQGSKLSSDGHRGPSRSFLEILKQIQAEGLVRDCFP